MPSGKIPDHFSDDERALVERVRPYTMTTPERLIANADAIEYAVRRDIGGAIVECGVWLGGSVLAMILTLQRLGTSDRDIYLFDTFEGMTPPRDEDTTRFGPSAKQMWEMAAARGRKIQHWLFKPEVFGLERVQKVVYDSGYPPERIHFVKGRVEDTVPGEAPESIAVLRLDTDWYESTRHELVHLYPRLSRGGVLIIDDYGHWDGSRKAVDEYFAELAPPVLLNRTDYAGRMAVKW